MSIICVRDGVMAADQGMWDGEHLVTAQLPKIWQAKYGRLAGLVGRPHAMVAARKALDAKALPDTLDLPDDSGAVLVNKDGAIRLYEGNGWTRIYEPFLAVGSANGVALGALWMGATAARAVEICIAVGPWAAGEVMTLALPRVEETEIVAEPQGPPPPAWKAERGL